MHSWKVPGACAAPREKRRAPLRAGERAPPRRGSSRRPPQGDAAPRSVRAEARLRAHGSLPNATPARSPRAHRAAPEGAPVPAGRDRCHRRRGQARTEDVAAQARRCACRPTKARRAPAVRAAARRCLRAGRKARSAPRRASRRREARGRAHRSRWARHVPWQTAVRRARLDAARECGPVPPWLYHQN